MRSFGENGIAMNTLTGCSVYAPFPQNNENCCIFQLLFKSVSSWLLYFSHVVSHSQPFLNVCPFEHRPSPALSVPRQDVADEAYRWKKLRSIKPAVEAEKPGSLQRKKDL